MDFLKNLIGDKTSELVAGLVNQTGFSTEQAEKFVPEAASSVVDAAKSVPDLDFDNLAGSAQSVLGAIDIPGLAQKTGVSPDLASNGLNRLAPQLLELFREKAGGAAGLASMLGMLKTGGVGDILGGVGRLFGK